MRDDASRGAGGATPDVPAAVSRVLAGCPQVVFAYLFGSAASGERRPLSDIDLAIFVGEGADPFQTRLAVADLLGRALRTDAVDVVVLNDAPPALAGRVLAGARLVLDRRPERRHAFESLTMRQYADFRLLEARLLAERYVRGRS